MAAEEDGKGPGSPAPKPVELDPSTLTMGGAPMGIVKGGTTSASYDNEMARRHHDAEARRNYQDQLFDVPQGVNYGMVDGDPVIQAVRLYNMQMSSAQLSPKLVLHYRNRDKTIRQSCVSELVEIPSETGIGIDRAFCMICPRCIRRGIRSDEAQMKILSTHRTFHIDTRRANTMEKVVYADERSGLPDAEELIPLAGTVTCDDIIRCSNFNCDYAVRIDDSNVYEV